MFIMMLNLFVTIIHESQPSEMYWTWLNLIEISELISNVLFDTYFMYNYFDINENKKNLTAL